ncbi:MAG: proline--tRNA ligase [Rickettsiales bacterium]|jgi:prolyl-tRNA synthetase|nr:proline--tRNA ligase [Rickettsiales bacterium]
MIINNLCIKRQIGDVAGATSPGHKIAIKGGYIHQTLGGIYTLSPLGCRVQANVEKIIRDEMSKIGGQEIKMPVVSGANLWIESGRYDTVDVLAKFKGRSDIDYVLNPTHEEVVVDFIKSVLESYRQLPFMVYQIQTKFRDELRARGGLIRTREFTMKDGYSFHETDTDLENYYACCMDAYARIFARCGLKKIAAVESMTGDMGGSAAHEFQLIHPSGEDTIYLCDKCGFNANKEVVIDGVCPKCGAKMREERGIEVGNIFQLGTKYSASMGLLYAAPDGTQKHPIMGCYGIGVGRTWAAVLEESADELGPKWNIETAPFAVEVIGLPDKTGQSFALAQKIHDDLDAAGVEILLDNRDARAGEKFADADLIAAPVRLIVSEKNIANGIVEVKYRVNNKDTENMKTSFAIEKVLAETQKAIAELK